ncbi:MAG: response regulator, partial [Pseudomonadales bacterium]|nr:response regulator [Pseudomonadales bacterium]
FEQVDGTSTRNFSGSGLGLAITRQLVHLHGGEIGVSSVLGEGSTFHFTLPVSQEPAERQEPPRALNTLQDFQFQITPEEPKEEDNPALDNSGFNILIVDDEPVNRQVLVNHLSLQSYTITEASDGREALSMLDRAMRFDLILLDIMMPGMSGYEVCKKLRENYPVHELPVIFLTARNQVTDLVTAFAAGANDYLSKPVAKNELLSRVSTHLRLLDIKRNLEQRVQERTRDLKAVNDKILRTQRQLIVQEKLASMGTLTAGIAHEIKNPLNFVNNFAELIIELTDELNQELEKQKSDMDNESFLYFKDIIADLNNNASSIHRHGERANNIVQSMMNLARGESGEWRVTDLNSLVDEF